MIAVKPAQANAFIKRPDPALQAVLIFGPNAGLVTERAGKLADYIANRDDSAGEIIRIDDGDLADNPDRLAIELMTVPMFGGTKLVRVKAGPKLSLPVIQDFLDNPPQATALIVEAGDLKKGVKLRALFEKTGQGAAVPCYGDDQRSLGQLIDEQLSESGLSITQDAKRQLISLIGSDRHLSRSELTKLTTYATGKSEVTIEDVDAVIGDTSNLTMDMIAFSAMSGRTKTCLGHLDRIRTAGTPISAILTVLGRHVARLHKVRTGVDANTLMETGLRNLRPRVHFRQEAEFTKQCRDWSAKRLLIALSRIQEASKRCRSQSALEDITAERLLISLCQMHGR